MGYLSWARGEIMTKEDFTDKLSLKEEKIQAALGTLPMKKITVSQPIELKFSLELPIEIEARTIEEAINEYKERINAPEILLAIVDTALNSRTGSYNTSGDIATIPRAVIRGKNSLKDEDIAILKIQGI